MTETPAESTAEESTGPETVYCRHCGAPSEVDLSATPDWLCSACERYQDSMVCPTCHSVVRISLMPEGSAPEPSAYTRRRASKEG